MREEDMIVKRRKSLKKTWQEVSHWYNTIVVIKD